MATAEIESGNCGYQTTVRTTAEGGRTMRIEIESTCPHVQKMAEELTSVDPYREISFRREGPETMRVAAQYLAHAACPVPVGVIKAIEIEAKMALPQDVTIKLDKE